jgi:uncharacterized lipoprotein YddW (UPF0748 family)
MMPGIFQMKSRMLILIMFVFMFMIANGIKAQIVRETRAVWVSTNFRLDWPPHTFNQEKQKQELIRIFDNIKAKNLNTVYFQVRSNGTVMFKSSFEALSPYITGKVGGEASYDPLKFAIEEAHKHGLEIHAWVNTVRCFAGSELSTFNDSNHIAQRKPEWVIEDINDRAKSYWLDPGLPEVREYISDLIEEMVENYDIDGVHLDFIRYPGKNFDDDFSYNVYSNGAPIDDWRRNNITSLVESISKKVKSKKPFVRVGAAPIGVFRNQKGMYGWEGFSEIYQDSREWLKRGLLDYVAPQIYWSLSDNTRFDLLAKDWVENSFGKHIVLGIGAYKENVKPEIEQMINFSRSINADGVAFFRYSNISDYNFENFSHKTLPALMSWVGGIYPEAPSKLTAELTGIERNEINFNWEANRKKSKDSTSYFALYNLPHKEAELQPDYLIDVIPADETSFILKLEKPDRVNYYFTLNSISKLWNESIESSNIVNIKFDDLNYFLENRTAHPQPVLVKEDNHKMKILFYADAVENIELIAKAGERLEKLFDKTLTPGKNIISFESDISKYNSLKIRFVQKNREVELRF